MRRKIFGLLLCFLICSSHVRASDTDARHARDRGDVAALQTFLTQARSQATQQNSAQAYMDLARLEWWLCEAAKVQKNNDVIEHAADDGIDAAEKAIALDPNSAEAHQLNGNLTGELIPIIFAGGMRKGSHAASELDRALELDSKNVDAITGRAIGYLFTPALFGGDKQKAVVMLQKAVTLDPAAEYPHIWLAQAFDKLDKHDDALREIDAALKLNPDREFTKLIKRQIENGK